MCLWFGYWYCIYARKYLFLVISSNQCLYLKQNFYSIFILVNLYFYIFSYFAIFILYSSFFFFKFEKIFAKVKYLTIEMFWKSCLRSVWIILMIYSTLEGTWIVSMINIYLWLHKEIIILCIFFSRLYFIIMYYSFICILLCWMYCLWNCLYLILLLEFQVL